MIKVKMKISGGFRAKPTAEAATLIRSYISTIRKNGEAVIEAISSAFDRNPWISEGSYMSRNGPERMSVSICSQHA